MEKLEVGMFIRDTRKGKIYKLTDFDLDFRPQKTTYDFEKASHNIIDLIEVGDYVNGVEVEKITDNEIMLVDTHLYIDKSVANDLIKTILTKEQFEDNCYKIGDDE